MIELTSVDQKYGGTQILWDLNLNIKKGSRTCIMGRNGVGKTTLCCRLVQVTLLSMTKIWRKAQ